jgi:hypothetical protein
MGRHSRPDEGDDEATTETIDELAATPVPTVEARPTPAGRHSHPERPQVTAVEDDPVEAAVDDAAAGRRHHGSTAHDLRLVRQHPEVRNRCLAALLVPFVIYTVVMFATGALSSYAIWVFAPTVAAGVLVGYVLDHAHNRYPDG